MAKLNEQVRQSRIIYGVVKKLDCMQKENKEFRKLYYDDQPLPDGIYKYQEFDDFYRMEDDELSREEIDELIEYRKLATLRSIRAWCVFISVILLLILLTVALWLPMVIGGSHY